MNKKSVKMQEIAYINNTFIALDEVTWSSKNGHFS
jgi:hypothetical protein